MQICAVHVINIVLFAGKCSSKYSVMADYMFIKEPNGYSSFKCLNWKLASLGDKRTSHTSIIR